ncbi:hypothetical protein FRC07_010120 [Ceratobasidium sp. 392]|nr:hypothetical protein FRC07_010120 [Ceratobasidium sp. 392]
MSSSYDSNSFLRHKLEERSDAENRWVSMQPYLLSKGYQLRPRYRPGWVPSWKNTGASPYDCEDSINSLPVRVLDATRINDEHQVVIKMIMSSATDREGEEELQILQLLTSPPYRDDPTNHAVPCLDSFPIPDVEGGTFVVMPLLSPYANPSFYNIAELHDFLDQVFEGLEFLHDNSIAHCDIAPANIMMDKHPLYDEPFHPFHQKFSLDAKRRVWPKYNRAQRPVRYYYIDFGYAKWFRDPTSSRLLTGIHAREAAPEQQSGPYDPFKADIYQLGALLRRDLIPIERKEVNSVCAQWSPVIMSETQEKNACIEDVDMSRVFLRLFVERLPAIGYQQTQSTRDPI